MENEKQGEEDGDDFNAFKYTPDEDDEFFRVLISRELTSSSLSMITSQWIVNARLDSIKWIFNAMRLMGFQLRTAYLSVIYFDKFLSRRMIDNEKYWAVRLLSVACLSLAAKMEECEVPLLVDFPMKDYCFEGKVIQRMEVLVLNTLEWEMNLITPFHYFDYLVSKFWNENPPGDVVPMDLVFAIIKDAKLMSYRCSVIAAAATLLTVDEKLTRQSLETKIKTFDSGVFETEDVFRCYTQMQELSLDRTNLTPVQCIGDDVDANSSFTPVVNTKRKRLEFDD
ncbi:cyclin-D5-1-like [Apium graveolens]|uniref:cyclin-D5-1-like n=1 Tax=Apium graveolens TaxID=4045 RepID=UPI003D794F83